MPDHWYSHLADLVVFLHFMLLIYAVVGEGVIVLGGFRKWRWVQGPIFRLTHLGVVVTVALQAIAGVMCPLTILEYRLREAAGGRGQWEISFVGRIFRGLLFYDLPTLFFTFLYVGFGILVVATVFLIPPRFPGRIGRPFNK